MFFLMGLLLIIVATLIVLFSFGLMGIFFWLGIAAFWGIIIAIIFRFTPSPKDHIRNIINRGYIKDRKQYNRLRNALYLASLRDIEAKELFDQVTELDRCGKLKDFTGQKVPLEFIHRI